MTEAAGRDDRPGAFAAAGMMLLSLSAAADDMHLNPEDALREALSRLATSFGQIESELKEQGRAFPDLTPAELDEMGARVFSACEEA